MRIGCDFLALLLTIMTQHSAFDRERLFGPAASRSADLEALGARAEERRLRSAPPSDSQRTIAWPRIVVPLLAGTSLSHGEVHHHAGFLQDQMTRGGCSCE